MDIYKVLNEYLYDKVWNEPYLELKRTYTLSRYTKLSKTGFIIVPGVGPVELPNLNEAFYVYAVDSDTLKNSMFIMDNGVWYRALDIVNNSDYTITIHGVEGRQYSRMGVYFKKIEKIGTTFMIVSKALADKCSPGSDLNKLHLEIKHDSSLAKPFTSDGLKITDTAHFSKINDWIQSGYTDVLLNGQRIEPPAEIDLAWCNSTFELGDYVEIVNDENIFISFTMDLTIDDVKRVFTNSGKEYTIVHTPKSLNPDNDVITFNTSTVYVHPAATATIPNKGHYLHNAQTDYKLRQITHGDFAIPEALLNAFTGYVGTENIKLVVQCRKFNKDNRLLRDNNYIDVLYRLTDQEILDFLEGNGPANLSHWKATNLVDSNYINLMLNPMEQADKTNMQKYVDTFGYQGIISLLIDRVVRFRIADNLVYPYTFSIPELLGDSVVPLMYKDGVKILQSKLDVSYSLNRSMAYIKLADDVKPPTGASNEMVLEWFEDSPMETTSFTPSHGDNSVNIPLVDFDIFIEDVHNVDIRLIHETTRNRYDRIDVSNDVRIAVTNLSTGYRIAFSTEVYGKKFIITPKTDTKVYEVNINDELVPESKPIIIPLIIETGGEVIPVIDVKTVVVTVNGYSLVEDVEYKLIHIEDDGKHVRSYVVVYSMEYLNALGDNVLEVIASKSESEHGNADFQPIEDVPIIGNALTWYDTLSVALVDGRQAWNPLPTVDGISIIGEESRAGCLMGTRTVYPNSIKKFVEEYHNVAHDERRDIVYDFFVEKFPVEIPTNLVLPRVFELYSLKLAVIANDIVNSRLSIAYDPDINALLLNIEDYNYLDAYDIIESTRKWGEYIDFYISYKTLAIPYKGDYDSLEAIAKHLIDDPASYGGYK